MEGEAAKALPQDLRPLQLKERARAAALRAQRVCEDMQLHGFKRISTLRQIVGRSRACKVGAFRQGGYAKDARCLAW